MRPDPRAKRRRAAKLFERGLGGAEVARRLSIARSTAMAWRRAWREGGEAAMDPKKSGRRPRVRREELAGLAEELMRGPRRNGEPGALWTLKTLARWLERRTGVRHHPGHVWKRLRAAGFPLPTLRKLAGRRLAFLADPEGNPIVLWG